MSLGRSLAIITLAVLGFGGASPAGAEAPAPERSIRLIGRSAAVVTGPEIRLGDLAEITSAKASDDDAVIALQKITLGRSPAPGREEPVAASKIIDRMKAAGVNLDSIGYTLPHTIIAKRASRAVSEVEVRQAIENAVAQTGRDVVIKQVVFGGDVNVAPNDTVAEAIPFASRGQGRLGFTVKMRNESGESAAFNVEALVDEWIELPVAKRPISRGAVVNEDDVMMARLNLSSIPGDAARERRGVVGLSTSSDISFGEVFRRNKLAIPPAIQANSRVTVVYRSAGFEATASGIALENGIVGQEIKVRNENSKKVISGTVLEPGLVGVRP